MISYTRLTECAALCLFAVAFAVAQANAEDELENLIGDNPSFEQNFQNWWTQGAAGAVYETDEDAVDGEKCAHIDVVQVTGTNWHSGITHNLVELEAGKQYTADFFAKADVNRVINLELKAAPPLPYAWIGGGDINITPEWTEYSKSFTANVDYPPDAAAQICFWVGQVTGQIWIDGVRVYEGPKQEREGVLPDISVQAQGKLVTSWAAIKAKIR